MTQLSKQTDEGQSEARFIMFIGLNQGFLGVSDSIPRGVRSVHLEDRQLIYLLHIIKKQGRKEPLNWKFISINVLKLVLDFYM